MNRAQLAHVLRAAAVIVEDGDILVLGSQAILGSFDAPLLPDEATRSVEADVAFWDDEDESKADRVEGAIGELSQFHDMYGYYAQGVSVDTAVLPEGWQRRLVAFARDDAKPSDAKCLDPHDLVVAKLVAGRKKDLEFTLALLHASLINADVLYERVSALPLIEAVRHRVRDLVTRCASRASVPPE